MIQEEFNENKILNMSKEPYKQFIKEKIKTAAFNYLRKLQEKHSKIRDIVYKKLEIQPYTVSPVFLDEEVNILHSLRSRAVDCKANYRNMYKAQSTKTTTYYAYSVRLNIVIKNTYLHAVFY